MNTKRYKVLKGAVKYLATSDDQPNPRAPEGTPLRKFQEVIAGERTVSYERDDDSLPEAINNVIINPFAYAVDPANRYFAPLSQRVQNESRMNPFLTAANIDAGDTTPARSLLGFIPAKCTISIPNASRDNPNAESQITGLSYYKKGKDSYTFPYGSKTGSDREPLVRTDIREAVPNGANYNLSFASEKI